MSTVPTGATRAHVSPPVLPCPCWSRKGGDIVVLIVPGVGKVEIPIERAAASRTLGDGRLAVIFSRVRDAIDDAWKWKDGVAPTGKATVNLTDADVEMLKQLN